MPGPPRPRVAWLKPAWPCRSFRPPCLPSRRPRRPLRPASPRHHGSSCLWHQAQPVWPLRPGHQLQLGISLTGPDIPPLLKVQAGALVSPVQPHQKPIHKVRTDPFFLIYCPLHPTSVLCHRQVLSLCPPCCSARTRRAAPGRSLAHRMHCSAAYLIFPLLTGRQPL